MCALFFFFLHAWSGHGISCVYNVFIDRSSETWKTHTHKKKKQRTTHEFIVLRCSLHMFFLGFLWLSKNFRAWLFMVLRVFAIFHSYLKIHKMRHQTNAMKF